MTARCEQAASSETRLPQGGRSRVINGWVGESWAVLQAERRPGDWLAVPREGPRAKGQPPHLPGSASPALAQVCCQHIPH